MTANTSEQRLAEALDAYNRGDVEAFSRHLADDIVWHVGGDHPLSGDYRGREAVTGYIGRVRDLTGGTLRLRPIEILADARHAGIFMQVTGQRGSRMIDSTLAEAIRLDDEGRWIEYWALAEDQEAVDAFWREEH